MPSPRWTPIAGWAAATATSIVLASVAILPVLRATQPRDAALAQLPAAQTSFPVPLPSAGSDGPKPADPTSAPASKRPRSSAPTPTAKKTPDKKATTPADTRTTPPATTEDGWTVTTAGSGLRTYVRSFQVEGGQAVIKVTSRGVVSVVTATPADGWAVQQVQNSPDNLAVYFNETGHSFIIHVTWWDDKPFAEVSEVGK